MAWISTLLLIVSNDGLFRSVEDETFTLGTGTQLRDIVESEHHILRRHGDWSTVGRVQNIVALKHQGLCLKDGLIAQRQVNGHLVTVEVGIESRTCQRVKLYGHAFDHFRLESLDAETVKRRSTVEQYGMTAHYIFENIPDERDPCGR
jgi:hypothetical protein